MCAGALCSDYRNHHILEFDENRKPKPLQSQHILSFYIYCKILSIFLWKYEKNGTPTKFDPKSKLNTLSFYFSVRWLFNLGASQRFFFVQSLRTQKRILNNWKWLFKLNSTKNTLDIHNAHTRSTDQTNLNILIAVCNKEMKEYWMQSSGKLFVRRNVDE